MDTSQRIFHFLQDNDWVPGLDDPSDIRFLAAGEYNENWLVTPREGPRAVFRINHGSQLGLTDQISYEFMVLTVLAASGVTPRPWRLDPRPAGWDLPGRGVLLMEYLPGRPLDYRTDAALAARVFSRVHAQPVPTRQPDSPAQPRLVVQANPILDIAAESLGLIERFPEHPLRAEKRRLLAYHEEVLRLAEEAGPLLAGEPLVLVNSEVNSHNFIVHQGKCWLVDWEKAVLSQRYQDLGHFLVRTTTLWKSDVTYSDEEKRAFLREYLRDLVEIQAGRNPTLPDFDTVWRATRILERTILLRALSWCFMAYVEYTQGDRALSNADTFAKIRRYLEEMEWILS